MTESLESLEVLESLTRGFFDASLVPSLVLDPETRHIVAANPAAIRFFGWPRTDLVGRMTSDLVADPVRVGARHRRGTATGPDGVVRKVRTAHGIRVVQLHVPEIVLDGPIFVELLDITDLVTATAAAEREVTIARDGAVGNGVPDPAAASEPGAEPSERDVTEALHAESAVAAVAVDLDDHTIVWANAAFASTLDPTGSPIVGTSIDSVMDDLTPRSPLVETLARFGGSIQQPVLLFGGRRVIAYGTAGRGNRAIIQFVHAGPDASPVAAPAVRSAAVPLPWAKARRLRQALGALVALTALITLVGWVTGTVGLLRIGSAVAPTSPSSGILLLVVAVVVVDPFAAAGHGVRTVPVVVAAVASIASLAARETGGSVALGRLVPTPLDVTGLGAGEAPSLGAALIVLVLSLVAALAIWAPQRGVYPMQFLLVVVSGGVLVSLLGFAYSLAAGALLARCGGMTLRLVGALGLATAASWVPVAQVGILTSVVGPRAGGRFARTVMPVGVVITMVAALVAVLLERSDVLGNVAIEMAFASVVALLALFGLLLYTSGRVNRLDESAVRAREDLEIVLAAFSDRHYRVAGDGLARPVTGSTRAYATPAAALVASNAREDVVEAINQTRRVGLGRSITFQPETKAGRLEVRIEPLSGDDIAMSVRDVSELAAASDSLAQLTARLEDEVRVRTAELERTNRDLEQFAYLASHDLQEPLRMVSTFVTKLADRLDDDLDERSRTYIGFAVDGAERMSELIDGLLRYSRAGRATPTVADVDLDRAVEVVLQTLTAQIEASAAVVIVSSELPRIRADEALLRQILQNLIANSLRFAERDRSPVVDVSAEEAGDGFVEVSITDNGIGIPPQFQQQIFEMFRRLHGRTTYPGTGIGLSLVQRLVEAHGGQVWLDTDYGPPGSRFVFTLPAAGTYRVRPERDDA